MISRIWHGWTTPGNADKYEMLLKEEIFIGIQNLLPNAEILRGYFKQLILGKVFQCLVER